MLLARIENPQTGFFEDYWYFVHWEYLIELGSLQLQGKIKKLHYRPLKRKGEYVAYFVRTDFLDDWFDLFNLTDEYSPDKYENRRKWYRWKNY